MAGEAKGAERANGAVSAQYKRMQEARAQDERAQAAYARDGRMQEARTAVLGRVRAALGGASASADLVAAGWAALPRAYQQSAVRSGEEILQMFEDRLHDYEAHVERVTIESVGNAMTRRLEARGRPAMIVPAGLPVGLLPAGAAFVEDAGFSNAELDRFTGVLTLATVAIATTGTLVLQTVPGQGRRAATLIPDYHLCVVDATDVVETVPEAMRRLQATASLPTTFISGPSATADIEMTRIKGVHGPRVLDVLLVVPAVE